MWCVFRVTGGELFEDIVAREYYSEADARYTEAQSSRDQCNTVCMIVFYDAYKDSQISGLIAKV